MTERMLLEALIEHHGIVEIIQMLVFICDAKAAEMAAYGEITQAKTWAKFASQLDCAK